MKPSLTVRMAMVIPPWQSSSSNSSFFYLPPPPTSSSSTCLRVNPTPITPSVVIRWRCVSEAAAAGGDAGSGGELTARERRQLRQQRREANAPASNWREQLEDRLLLEAKNKKRKPSRAAQLSINDLTALGPQWWALRVSRTRAPETTRFLARALSTSFPEVQFKIYNPSIRERRKLKDGVMSVKQKPLVPGFIYLHCVLNRQVHDFVNASQGILGFLGPQVEVNKDEYFTKPRPVSADVIEAILQREKEQQEIVDKAFKEKEAGDKKASQSKIRKQAYLLPGVSVRVLSGPFADYTGSLKELYLKKRKATVELLLLGKESTVELDIDQIDAINA